MEKRIKMKLAELFSLKIGDFKEIPGFSHTLPLRWVVHAIHTAGPTDPPPESHGEREAEREGNRDFRTSAWAAVRWGRGSCLQILCSDLSCRSVTQPAKWGRF